MTESHRLAYFFSFLQRVRNFGFAFLLAVLTNRGIRTVGLTNCTFSLISLDLLPLLAPGTTVQPKWKAEKAWLCFTEKGLRKWSFRSGDAGVS